MPFCPTPVWKNNTCKIISVKQIKMQEIFLWKYRTGTKGDRLSQTNGRIAPTAMPQTSGLRPPPFKRRQVRLREERQRRGDPERIKGRHTGLPLHIQGDRLSQTNGRIAPTVMPHKPLSTKLTSPFKRRLKRRRYYESRSGGSSSQLVIRFTSDGTFPIPCGA